MSFYEFKAPSGSEVTVTYENPRDTPSVAIAHPRRTEQKELARDAPSTPRSVQAVESAGHTNLDQCIEFLVSKAKQHRDRGTVRIAVHQLVPKGSSADSSATYGDGLSAAVERSILKIGNVQLVTRRRLRDLQLEQKLNQADWNESGEKDGRLGLKSVDFIVRGTYSAFSGSNAQILEIELLEPLSGQIIAARKFTVPGG